MSCVCVCVRVALYFVIFRRKKKVVASNYILAPFSVCLYWQMFIRATQQYCVIATLQFRAFDVCMRVNNNVQMYMCVSVYNCQRCVGCGYSIYFLSMQILTVTM